ncbi:MAG: hypothetical protein ACWA5X_00185 [bacterium]
MNSLRIGIGCLLGSMSLLAGAGTSEISVGSVPMGGQDDVTVVTSGNGGENRVSISGHSVHIDSVSSVVSDRGGRSSISIGPRSPSSVAGDCHGSAHGVSISGAGKRTELEGNQVDFLCVSGVSNQVSVAASSGLELISLSGSGNTVRVNKATAKITLLLGGSSNKVYLPRSAKISVTRTGTGNQVVRF